MNKNISLKEICITSIFTALTVIMAQIAIPLPNLVPFTLQIFAIYLTSIILGSKLGSLSQLIYVALGAVGVPVFANFSGGMQCILGPTGGFIISFPIIAWIIGYASEKNTKFFCKMIILFISLVISYAMGILQLSFVSKISFVKSTIIMLPFIPFAIIKIGLAYFIGNKVKKSLMKAGLLK